MAAVPSITAIATEALALHQDLKEAAIVRNEELVLQRANTQKRKRLQAVQRLRTLNKRLARAVQGVMALSDVCTTPEVQALIKTGGGLSLWNGSIRIGGDGGIMECRFGIALTVDGLFIYDQTSYDGKLDVTASSMFLLPYHGDLFLCSLRLGHIATASGCNPYTETKRYESLDGNSTDPTNILFQVLADCANPRMLARYLRKAIKP